MEPQKERWIKKKTSERSPREVLDSHLHLSKVGAFEEDLSKNYSPDLVILTGWVVFDGYDGMRHLAALLSKQLPNMKFDYKAVLLEREVGFLEWTAKSNTTEVCD